MNKHTPGPWKMKHSESKNEFNIIGTMPGGKYKIARVPYLVIDAYEVSNEINKKEAERDAKLISVAPELLKVAKRVLFIFDNENNYPEGTIGYEIAQDAKLAIRKATEL